jgi:lysophospholipase L1-like esterase
MPAQFTKHFVQDLQQDIKIRQCGTIVFNADNESNVISIDLYNGTEEYSGGGSVVGACICPDGSTVPLTGSISGKTASVILTGDCFAFPGQIGIGVQVVSGTVKTTVLKAIYNVELFETDDMVDPGSRITASVGQLVADIEAATAEIPASDMASLMSGISPTFSASTNYAAGAYVYYDGTLYKFISAHAAGSWTGTDATAVALGNDVTTLNNDVSDLRSAIDEIVDVTLSPNLLDTAKVTDGYYIENGTPHQYAGWSYSDFIPVRGNEKYLFTYLNSANSGFMQAIRGYVNFYDSGKQIISGTGSYVTNTDLFTSPANAQYCIVSTKSENLSLAKKPMFCLSSFTETEGILLPSEYVQFGSTVVIKPEQIEGKVDKTGTNQVTKENADFINKSVNLFNHDALTPNTYISNTDGTEVSYNGWSASDYIPIKTGTYALVNLLDGVYSVVVDGCYGALYDADKNFIPNSGFAYNSTAQNIFTVSNLDAAYIRISNHTNTYKAFTMFGLQSDVVGETEYSTPGWFLDSDINIGATVEYPWGNKKWCDYGDSTAYNITWCEYANAMLGATEIYNRGIGSSAVSHDGQSPAYVTMSGELIGRYQGDWDAYHALVDGLTEGVDYYEISTTMMCSQERVNTIPTDSDVVSILAGMNDFETITSETLGDVDDMWDGTTAATKTFCGAYRRMLHLIHERVPNANIILCVPTKYSAEYTNGTRTTAHLINEQMREKIREIGRAYGCQVVDFETLFSPVRATTYNASTNPYGYLSDGTHPNTQGNNAMGLLFAKEAIKNYFPVV